MLKFFLALLVMLTTFGCGIFVDDGPWDLLLGVGVAGEPIAGDVAVEFPDGVSLDNSSKLELWALEIQGIRCQDMMEGAVGPQDAKELGRLLVQLPPPEGAWLRGLPDQQVLFYAEALDSDGTVLLKGCNTARARKNQGISVDMICVCHPVSDLCAALPEQEGNGIDDDCDGLTDECTSADDCDDDNGCTQDICVEGICQHSKFPDNLGCTDCTQSEGPHGDASCSNNIDDDCDGRTDGVDDDCWPASQCSQGNGIIDSSSDFEAGGSPKDIVAAYLDGDDILDLALANYNDRVDVLLGVGGGSFSAVEHYDAGDFPTSIAAADLNLDGFTDLVVANYNSHNVSILMGQGDGTFPAHQEFASGVAQIDNPKSVVVAYFNSDSYPDLAVVNASGFTVGILLGQGDGTFDPPLTFNAGTTYNPCDLVTADFNSDGVTDLAFVSHKVFANYEYVYVLTGGNDAGLWDGTFSDPSACKYQVEKGTNSITAADFDADGITDIALTHSCTDADCHDLSILLGQGSGGQWDGTFSVSTINTASQRDYPNHITTGYFNSDCIMDMAVSSKSEQRVRIYLGIGDGTFSGDDSFYIGATVAAISSADFDADGVNDIAVASDDSGSTHDKVYVLLGKKQTAQKHVRKKTLPVP